MKYVRIGNDIGIKWYIFRNCAVENLTHANAKVYLFDRNGRQQAFNYTIEDGYIQGTFYGKDQVTTGNYRLVLTENEGNKEMVTLDYIDAFVLSAKLKNMTQSGEDAAIGIKTEVVELSSTISTDKQFADLTDYVKREELEMYAKVTDLESYAKAVDLQSYALKTDIPDTSSYLTSESDPTVPAYVKSIKQSDIDAWNSASGSFDLSNYVTKNELDAASYITADQVTYPDYSTTYANINHTHNQYLTEHQDLSAYALKTDIPDTSNFATKDEIVPAYDDTEVRNLIAGKQDKLNASQIANLNADHSKYLTEHQDLSAYALKTELFSKDYNDLTNKPTIPSEYDDAEVRNLIDSKQDKLNASQIANLNADHSKYLTEHQDLSAYAKTVDLQSYVTKNDLDAASYITADQVTYPDYSNTYANIVHTHSEYALKTELFSKDYNDLTNKPTIPSEYDDTQVRNLIASKQDKLNASQIANLNADHSKYLTEHQTLPDYSNTYANINHTHDQYLTEHQDLSAYAKTVDLQSYVTKNDLDAASYITADQVTYPDYSNTYANINHTHNQYLTEHQDLSAYVKTTDLESYAKKTELFSKDYNDLTNKPTIPSEYDDTEVRNLIAGKQDKLSEQQIANLNADHSKYLTEHQTLPDYSNTYAPLVHTHSEYLESESDPTVPAYVKSIRQSDIDAWNAATGGVDLSNYVNKNELNAASYITADQVTYPDYSNTYANIVHSHSEYAKAVDLQSYALKTELFSKDYNDLTNKPTIPSEYDDTQVRNMIDSKQDKLSASQIANLNADHSKYLTEHQALPDYSTTYAPFEHTHSEYLTSESDPTVPAYVKSITEADITNWNTKYDDTNVLSRLDSIESTLGAAYTISENILNA